MALASLPTRARAEHVNPSPLVRALVGLNTWCLIEPAIGVAWQWALARSVGTVVATRHWLLLASSLWLVYAADRWLDTRPPRRLATARHAFWARQREPLAMAWCAVLCASLVLAGATLTATEWALGGALLLLVAAYLFAVHRMGLGGALKKASVALIYGAGVGVFLWPGAIEPRWLAGGQLALAALAGCNLAAVAAFERMSQPRNRQRVAYVSALLGLALLGASAVLPQGPAALLVAVSSSALALAALLLWPHRLDSELAHALCDVLLLAPLLWR